MDDGDLGLFLDRNLLKDGSSVKMSFSESGNVYEGTIKGSAEAGYTLHLPFPTRLLKTPSSACTKKGLQAHRRCEFGGHSAVHLDGE